MSNTSKQPAWHFSSGPVPRDFRPVTEPEAARWVKENVIDARPFLTCNPEALFVRDFLGSGPLLVLFSHHPCCFRSWGITESNALRGD